MNDRAILVGDDLLNDKIIHAAQMLIKKANPQINGFQDPVLSQLRLENRSKEAVQIHHTGKCHWVTSSSLNDHVAVYDSLHSGLSEGTTVQLAQAYKDHIDALGNLQVDIPPVQQQSGCSDCGLFAIAFAHELARGANLKAIAFDQGKMRPHLIECFENKIMMPFPRLKNAIKRKQGHELVEIKTFCCCNLPEGYDDMVQCDLCDEWFHYDCMNLITAPTGKWMCVACAPPKKKKRS